MPSTPSFIEPMAAKLVDSLPEGPNRVYEIKLDGYRVLASKNDPSDSRHGLNTQFRLPDLLRQSIYSRLAGYETSTMPPVSRPIRRFG